MLECLEALCSFRAQPVCSVVRQTGRMGERAATDPPAAIAPMQQMLASSTGALLTSIFGETKHTKTGGGQQSLSLPSWQKHGSSPQPFPSSVFLLVDRAVCVSSFVLLCFQSPRWTLWRFGCRPSRRPSTKVSLCFSCPPRLSSDALLALLRLAFMLFPLFQTFASSPLCFCSFTLHAGSVGKWHSAFQVWVSTAAANTHQNLKWLIYLSGFSSCSFSHEDKKGSRSIKRLIFKPAGFFFLVFCPCSNSQLSLINLLISL